MYNVEVDDQGKRYKVNGFCRKFNFLCLKRERSNFNAQRIITIQLGAVCVITINRRKSSLLTFLFLKYS